MLLSFLKTFLVKSVIVFQNIFSAKNIIFESLFSGKVLSFLKTFLVQELYKF